MAKEVILIGGSHEGERHELADDCRRLELLERPKRSPQPILSSDEAPELSHYSVEVYVGFELWNDKHEPIHIWHLSTMTSREAIQLLLNAYAERVS